MKSDKNGLHELLRKLSGNIETYFEVGTCEGASLKVIVENNPTLREVSVCDMWGTDAGGSGRGSHAHIADLLVRTGYRNAVEWYDGNSHEILPNVIMSKKTYDVVTIDGDHSLHGNLTDLILGWHLVRPGGWITFDDLKHPAHQYLMDVALRFQEIVPVAETIWSVEYIYGAVGWRKP